jgi:putative tryptophan/tyrosine transport system substrate-binding protein
MNKRFALWLLAIFFLTTVSRADAQQTKKVSRIGYLSPSSASADSARVGAFRQGLLDLGYVQGKNIVIDYRYAEGKPELLPDLAAELVRFKVDVIMTFGGPGTLAAKGATKTIPIVITDVSDPVALGLIASLAHPGGNVTGLSPLAKELSGKQLELLMEAFPRVSRVAVFLDQTSRSNALSLEEIKVAAGALQVALQPLQVRGPDDFEPTFSAVKRERAGALIVLRTASTNTYRARIVDFTAKSRLPAMYADSEFTDAGGLMSYGSNRLDLFRRAATYVDKILKGAKPADLPVEQPKNFEFIINLKAAKQIGVTIPPNVLARADRVIR